MPARKKALAELKAHQKACSLQDESSKVKKTLKDMWNEEVKKPNIQSAYSCRHCWGKIYWDKSITEVELAEKQAIADLVYHEKHECGSELTKPKIAIYFSPNEGGNEHAPLSYAEEVDKDSLMLERICFQEILQEQMKSANNKGTDWIPWILVGGGILILTTVVSALFGIQRKKKGK